MLKYNKKNQAILVNEVERLLNLREQDAIARHSITETILQCKVPDEDSFKELFENPDYQEDEGFITNVILFKDLIEELGTHNFCLYFADTSKKIDISEFLNNPYIKNIKFDKEFVKNQNNIKLEIKYFDKYELQQVNTCSINYDYIVTPNLGFFNERVNFPVLTENDDVWMSITPSEINTMENHINKMKGKIIVFGLGLGYFAYMTALKDDVESITVVELNKDIIDIFNENILVQMDRQVQSKINIVCDDAKDIFLDKEYMNSFDSCFVDIWMNSIDGSPLYCYFKENEKQLKVKPRYWIEDDILLTYKYDMLSYISYVILKDVFESEERVVEYYNIIKSKPFTNKIEKYFDKNKYIIDNKKDIHNLVFNTNIMNKILKLSVE